MCTPHLSALAVPHTAQANNAHSSSLWSLVSVSFSSHTEKAQQLNSQSVSQLVLLRSACLAKLISDQCLLTFVRSVFDVMKARAAQVSVFVSAPRWWVGRLEPRAQVLLQHMLTERPSFMLIEQERSLTATECCTAVVITFFPFAGLCESLCVCV